MYKIEIEELLDMPIEAAFNMLTDHANYKLYPGINGSQLLKSGREERNGLGAVREIKVSGAKLQEEIVKFDRNRLMEYRVIEAKPFRIVHPLGRMVFSEVEGKTRVKWTSEFSVQVPLIGGWLDNYVGPRMANGFSIMLQGVAKRYHFFNK